MSTSRTFWNWTYSVTINLFSLYSMNFMFHTMFDAAGVVLRVTCDGSFSQGSVSTIFKWGEHGAYMCKKSPVYNSAKIMRIDRDFPKLWSHCHLFMVHSVWPLECEAFVMRSLLKSVYTSWGRCGKY